VYKLILEGSVEQHILASAKMKLLLDRKVQDIDAENTGQQNDQKENELNVMKLLRNDILEEQE
jgi:SNF2 family DNA or RNA helicase